MFDHVIRDHVATVPYGMVSAVKVSKHKAFDLLRDCAAALPVGPVPQPAARPEANVPGVPDRVAGSGAKVAGAVAEQVKAHRDGSRGSAA
jgi:hypothetical protein